MSLAPQSRIGRLVLVAGPSAAGKSFLIDGLRDGRFRDIARKLGILSPAEWAFTDTKRIAWRDHYALENAVLHYDFLRPWKFELPGFAEDDSLAPLESAERSTVVTLLANGVALRRAIGARRRSETVRYLLRLRPAKVRAARDLCRRLDGLYRRPGALEAIYAGWMDFCRSRGIDDHWVLERATGRLFPATELAARPASP